MKKINALLFSFIALLFALPGCSKKKPLHRTRSLQSLKPALNFDGHQDGVSLAIRQLNTKDCVKLFGRSGRRLVSKTRRPLAPLHVSITNRSENPFIMSPKNIDLPLASDTTVANYLKPSVGLKTVGMIAGGAVLTGLFAVTGTGLLFLGASIASSPLIVSGIVTCSSAAAIFLIGTPVASAIKGVQTVNERRIIGDDIAHKSLNRDIRIEPNTTVDMLVFVPLRKMKKNFTVVLENRNLGDDVIFDVTMAKNTF